MLGLAHTICSEGLHDRAFLDRYCTGFETFRAYLTGEALALMLDRYAPGWKDAVENAEDEPAPLDSLLIAAMADRPETSCGFSAAERAQVLERATDAVSVTVCAPRWRAREGRRARAWTRTSARRAPGRAGP